MATSPPQVRLWVGALLALGALAGVTGASAHVLFSQPTNLKYAATIAVPLLVLAALWADEPLLIIVPVLVVAAPFGGYVATFGGLRISPVTFLLLAGTCAAVLSGGRPRSLSTAGMIAAPALLLFALPLFDGNRVGAMATLLGAMALTAWLVARAAALEGGLRVVLAALVASAVVQAAIAIWEFRTGHQLNLYGAAGNQVFGTDYFFGFDGKSRPTGSFYDPISLGNVLALACPLAMSLVIAARSQIGRVATAGGGVLIALALALSLSRMSWIAAALGLCVTLVLLPRAVRRRVIPPAVAVVTAVVLVALSLSGGALVDRFSSILNPTSPTVKTAQGDRERIALWHAAGDVAAQHPVAGVGFGRLLPRLEARVAEAGPGSHAQSTYLQLIGEAGAFGGLALLLVLAGLGTDLVAGLRREGWHEQRLLAAGMSGALVALLISWGTDYTIRYVPVAMTIAVLFGAIASQGRRGGWQ